MGFKSTGNNIRNAKDTPAILSLSLLADLPAKARQGTVAFIDGSLAVYQYWNGLWRLRGGAPAPTLLVLQDGPVVTWNYALSSEAKLIIGGNRALNITNLPGDGKVYYGSIRIIQDNTGGRSLSLAAGHTVINGGAGIISLTATAGARDIWSFTWDGYSMDWTYGKNYTAAIAL